VSNLKTCFNRRETGHFIAKYSYPKTAPSTFSNSMNGPKQMTGLACVAPGKTQQSYGKAKVNHVYVEQDEDTPDVVLGEFLVQSFLAIVLFDFGATHSFISSYVVEPMTHPQWP
jgi:hypothetical protein